jgi:hypothetical protein
MLLLLSINPRHIAKAQKMIDLVKALISSSNPAASASRCRRTARRIQDAPVHASHVTRAYPGDRARGTSTISATTSTATTGTDDDRIGETSPRRHSRRAALGTLAALAAALASPPSHAVPFPSLLGGSSDPSSSNNNDSVVRALRQRQKRERLFGAADADPRPLLAARVTAARAEAARIPLLAKINQPDSARMLLREKNLGNLRRDLAYLTGAYSSVVTEQDVRGVVEGVERLDGGLKKLSRGGGGGGGEEAEREIKALVADLDARLERVAAAVTALEGEAR